MRPTLVDSGAKALDALEAAAKAGKTFPLLLLDAMMPEMDGFTFAEELKKRPELTVSTIMMLSSAGRPGGAKRDDLGIAAYMTKPVKQSELLDAILSTLDQQVAASGRDRGGDGTVETPARRLRLLLAEDNPVNQKVAIRILEKRGHTVTVANSGLDVLEAVQQDQFDLVLMDVQMPDMDGFEATRALRIWERSTGKRIPIVAMTAHAMKGDRERCLDAGMDAYVAKPIQAQELIRIVDALTRNDPPLDAQGVEASRAGDDPCALFDAAAALRGVDGDLDLLRDVIGLFIDGEAAMLAAVRDDIDRQNGEALERSAHKLKGSLAVFEARRARSMAAELERLGKDGDWSGVEPAFAALQEEVARLKIALAQYQRDSLK
jgi:CheY-like chemotaxis protein